MLYGFCAEERRSGDLEGGGVSVLKSDLMGGVSFRAERLE